jgi:ABC-type transport system involved in multi-copper enzyme maturation permease subunit
MYGDPYAGHQETPLYLEPFSSEQRPEFRCIAFVTTTGLDASSVVIYVNGSILSPYEYSVSNDSSGAILFRPNLLLSDVVADYRFSTNPEQFAITLLELMPMFIAVLAVFLGSDLLIREFSEHTGFITFTTPARRDIIMLGKFISAMAGGAVALLIFYVALTSLSYFTLGSVATYIPLSLGFAILYLSSCLSLAFLIGSLSRGIAPSVVVTFAVLLLILPAIQMAGEGGGNNMWFIPTFAAGVIGYSLQFEHYPQDLTQGGTPIFYPHLGLSITVLVAYCLVSLLVCSYLFSRREMRN